MSQSVYRDKARVHRDAAVSSARWVIVGLALLVWNLVSLHASLMLDQDRSLAIGAVGSVIAAAALIFWAGVLVREILNYRQALVQLQHALAQDAAAARALATPYGFAPSDQ